MTSEAVALAVACALLRKVESDRAAGLQRTLAEYQSQFPGHEEVVAREFAALTTDETDADRTAEPPTTSTTPPRTLGPYRIERELGRGGQGAVFLAFDPRLQRRVALKTLPSAWAASGAALLRLSQEARVLASVDHPGLCPVYEAGAEDGVPYLAMRYVEGETLAARFARRTSAPDGAALLALLALVERIARAAHAAHEAGVVHRDLKPANVVVGADEQPVVLDFGLASAAGVGDAELTATGDVLGTPLSMAPEQAAGDVRAVDRRSDVWALGVLLFEGATGVRPFDGPTRAAVLEAVRHAEPPDPRRANPRVSADLRTVLSVALAKSPADRYATALAFAEDLRRVRTFEPVAARPLPRLLRAARFVRRRPAVAALVCALAVGVPSLCGFAAWQVANAPRLFAAREAEIDAAFETEIQRGFARYFGDDFDGAEKRFLRAAALRPAAPDALVGATYADLRRMRLDAAEARLDAFRSANGSTPIVERLRVELLRRRDDVEAANALEASLPETVDHLACLVEGLREFGAAKNGVKGAATRAAEWFGQAMERTPKRRRLYVLLHCEAVGMTHAPDAARRAAATARLAAPDWEGEAAAGRALLRSDPKAAVDAFERAAAMSPEFVYEYAVAEALAEQGASAEAAAVMRKLTRRRPDDATAFLNLALFEEQAKDLDGALASARKAAELRPDRAEMLVALGHFQKRTGDTTAAAATLRQAVALAPEDLAARITLVRTLSTLGAAASAETVEHARRAVALDGRSVEARWELVAALLAADDTEAVEEALAAAVSAAKSFATYVVDRAEAAAGRGDRRLAHALLRHLERAIAPEPLPAELASRAAALRSVPVGADSRATPAER